MLTDLLNSPTDGNNSGIEDRMRNNFRGMNNFISGQSLSGPDTNYAGNNNQQHANYMPVKEPCGCQHGEQINTNINNAQLAMQKYNNNSPRPYPPTVPQNNAQNNLLLANNK
jgi:hypothetical protein